MGPQIFSSPMESARVAGSRLASVPMESVVMVRVAGEASDGVDGVDGIDGFDGGNGFNGEDGMNGKSRQMSSSAHLTIFLCFHLPSVICFSLSSAIFLFFAFHHLPINNPRNSW